MANRLVTWATGSGHASSAAKPLALLAERKQDNGGASDKHGANGDGAAAATTRQDGPQSVVVAGAAAADAAQEDGPKLDTAKADAAGTRRASAPTVQLSDPPAVATGGSRWHRRSLEGRPAGGSPTAGTPAVSTPAGAQHRNISCDICTIGCSTT